MSVDALILLRVRDPAVRAAVQKAHASTQTMGSDALLVPLLQDYEELRHSLETTRRIVHARFDEALSEHDDKRGVLIVLDLAETNAKSYDAAVLDLEKAGFWCSLAPDDADVKENSATRKWRWITELGGVLQTATSKGERFVRGADLRRTGVTAAQLRELSSCRSLEWLAVGGEGRRNSEPLEGVALASLGQVASLKRLYLSELKLADRDLGFLEDLANLEALSIREIPIKGIGLGAPSGTALRSLELAYTALSDAGLKAISELDTLTRLDVEPANVTDSGMVHLGRLRGLATLGLGRTRISDKGLGALQGLQHLTTLSLRSVSLGPDAIDHLLALRALRHLDIAGTGINAEDAVRLCALPALERLEVSSDLLAALSAGADRPSRVTLVLAQPRAARGLNVPLPEG